MSEKCYGLDGWNIRCEIQHMCYIKQAIQDDLYECPYSNTNGKGKYVFDKIDARQCPLFAENKKGLLKKIAKLSSVGLEGSFWSKC